MADELVEFARRLLGEGEALPSALARAAAASVSSRFEEIAVLAKACREARDAPLSKGGRAGLADGATLSATVAAELDFANARLGWSAREVLGLRELLGLSYGEIARVMDLEVSAVAGLLARARLELRSRLRDTASAADTGCAEGEQTLQVMGRGLDREQVGDDEIDWLFQHIGACPGCQRAHSEMHEASVVYRAWVWQ